MALWPYYMKIPHKNTTKHKENYSSQVGQQVVFLKFTLDISFGFQRGYVFSIHCIATASTPPF